MGMGREKKSKTDMRKDICNQDKMEFGVGSNHMHSFFRCPSTVKKGNQRSRPQKQEED